MKEKLKKCYMLSVLVYLFMVAGFISSSAFAGVNVYCEGAYTENDLILYVYADITDSTELRSAGVKVGYATSVLTLASAERNNDVWYLGNENYNSPETTTPGEVVFVLGKLDPAHPGEGVSGNRVLLGKILFNRLESIPPNGFDISLALGKSGSEGNFANFVDTSAPAQLLDATVTFGEITIAKRGDANADENINVWDVRFLRQIIGTDFYSCYADGNGDGNINVWDVRWLRQNIGR